MIERFSLLSELGRKIIKSMFEKEVYTEILLELFWQNVNFRIRNRHH